MSRVLVLRPEPGASATVKRARERGLDAVAAPLFEIEQVPFEVPDMQQFDGLLLTSANAVRFGPVERLRGLLAYAVGQATAETARDAGFDIAATGDAGVEKLLDSLENDLKLLHLCGEDRLTVATARQKITPLVVYRAKFAENPDFGQASVALVHSPRAGRRFAELVQDRQAIAIAAISAATAEAAGEGWKAVEIAETPTDEALLAVAERLCNNLQR